MIFEISEGHALPLRSDWEPGELELEKYLIFQPDKTSKACLFDPRIFGEPLLMLENQVSTKQQKRADIVALDQNGYGVFIELKRREAKQGVETQALQYLANYANLKGERFLERFKGAKAEIDDFLGDDYDFNKLNAKCRIVLVARSFDDSVLSIGEWLASQGVAFRCIEYMPFRVGSNRFLSFSVRFDRSREPLYQLSWNSREPQCFWHNIGIPPILGLGGEVAALDAWWRHNWEKGMVSAGFNEERGDAGDRILNSYVAQDTVIAYASGYGALGWGIIEAPQYDLVGVNFDRFTAAGLHRHRLTGIRWKWVVESVTDAISAKELKERFKLNHPIQTKSKIRRESAELLLKQMKARFKVVA